MHHVYKGIQKTGWIESGEKMLFYRKKIGQFVVIILHNPLSLQHIRGYHYKIKPHVCTVCKHSYALKGDMRRCRHSTLQNKTWNIFVILFIFKLHSSYPVRNPKRRWMQWNCMLCFFIYFNCALSECCRNSQRIHKSRPIRRR